MDRAAPGFRLLAFALAVVGLVTLAAPAPAQAMDPQLILALASAAGAIALITGYLIVANYREKQRAASLEGIYTCSSGEANGPMGCGGSGGAEPAFAATAPETPMAGDHQRAAPPADGAGTLAYACPGSQAAGPMGCSGSGGPAPAASVPASSAPEPVQGQ